MFYKIRHFLAAVEGNFIQIPQEQKEKLSILGQYIASRYQNGLPVRLMFVCTHNSRRSHFGQLAAALASTYYAVDEVYSYSGGTEVTALNKNAIRSLQQAGFEITKKGDDIKNPIWQVSFGVQNYITCYSKLFNAPENPHNEYAAILTCTQAEANCPLVKGMDLRLSLPYDDPGRLDNTPEENEAYRKTFEVILRDIMYAFKMSV